MNDNDVHDLCLLHSAPQKWQYSSGRFESYDYGPANFDHYGQKLPIAYDLSKVLVLQCFPLTCGSFWPFVGTFDHYYQETPIA